MNSSLNMHENAKATDILKHGLSSDPRQGIRGPKHPHSPGKFPITLLVQTNPSKFGVEKAGSIRRSRPSSNIGN